MPEVRLEVDRDRASNNLQVSIWCGDSGYRLAGPKYLGDSEPLLGKTLTASDVAEIRNYLNEAFPEEA